MLDSASVNSISSMPSPVRDFFSPIELSLSYIKLTSVPVEESLPPEHGSELLGDSLEQLLDGGGVTDEGGSHLETSWWNVTNSNLDVVGDPLHEV